MSNYIDPKTDWKYGDAVGVGDLNRIEKNIKSLKDEDIEIEGSNTFSGNNTFEGEIEQEGKITLNSEIVFGENATFSGVLNCNFNLETPFIEG